MRDILNVIAYKAAVLLTGCFLAAAIVFIRFTAY